jgi:hypothetical protein
VIGIVEVNWNPMTFLTSLRGRPAGVVGEMVLMSSDGPRKRIGFPVQSLRGSHGHEIAGISRKLPMTGVAGFRTTGVSMAVQTRDPDQPAAVVGTMAGPAFAEIVPLCSQEIPVKRE